MKPGKTFWRIVIATLLVIAVLAVHFFTEKEQLVTDVYSLFTDLNASDADRAAMREVVSKESRIVALRLEGASAAIDAQTAADYLVKCGAAKHADVAGTDSFSGIGKALYDNRMTLLFPHRLASEKSAYEADGAQIPFESWLADRTAANLDSFLASPQSLVFSELVPNDPMLLMPPCLKAVPDSSAAGGAIVLAEAAGPSTDGATQQAVIDAVEHLRNEFAAHGTTLHATGAVFFAHESEARIKADIARLNIAMTVLLLVFMVYYLRSLRTMIAVALPVLLSWLLAIVTLFVFEKHVYALALGIGGILGGISVDCPVHVMLHRRADEATHVPAMHRLIRPMMLGAFASIVVFAFLLLSNLPVIRQTGLLVGGGLALSYFMILPCFAAFPPPSNPAAVAGRLEVFDFSRFKHGLAIGTIALALLAVGSLRLYWNDSVDALQPPMDSLYAEDALVRGSAGKNSGKEYVVSFGRDISDAIANARKLSSDGLASLFATEEEARAAAAWEKTHGIEFQERLNKKLIEKGYDAAAFKPLFANVNPTADEAERYRNSLNAVASALPAGLNWMMGASNGCSWIVSQTAKDDAATVAQAPHTYRLDIRGQLQEAFGRYRADTTRLSLFGFLAASLVIVAACGVRRGLCIIAVPTLSLAATFGVFGIFGTGISLFNIIGMLLGYGLSMDYALFANQPESSRASIRFSAYTTMTAFAALVISVIPSVRALGLSVLLVIFFTLVQCELSPAAPSNEPR
jgi:predicted exporter